MRFTRLLPLVLLLAGTVQAQGAPPAGARPVGAPATQAPGQLSGVVVDDAGQPIGGASIAVRGGRDSALVNGAIARADGAFRVEGLAPGRYSVRVRALGFAPLVRPLVVTAEAPRVDLGRVPLASVATQIGGVASVAEREAAVLAPDRNSYDVKNMPAASGGNAVDVLRNVPGVEVDGDNKVSLRGNQNVVVQVNGRPTPMRGEQLGNFLAQLPANMVTRVEVVPNPSAKDDPEGMAGILNVVLKQNADLGTSGGVMVGGGTTGMVNANGNLGYQKGILSLFGSYGFMRDDRELSGYTNREQLFTTPVTFLNADNLGGFQPNSHNVTGNAELKLRPKDVLSSNLLFSKRRFDRRNDNFYSELDAERVVTGRYDRLTTATSRDATLDYSLAYKHTEQQLRNEQSAELRINRSTTDFDSRYLERALTADGDLADRPELRQLDGLAETRTDLTLQTDVVRPFGAVGKMEFGYKGVLRRLDNEFDAAQWSHDQGAYLPDIARSNAFEYQDQVHAVYGVLSRSFGKLNLQGGVRAEQARSEFDLATTGESFDNTYRSLYPSGLVSYDLSAMRQVKLSYSKRVQRPDTRQMNPFTFREDALTVFRGNPYLRPEYTHAMELGFQSAFAKGSVQVTPFFRHTVGAVRNIRSVDDTGVSTTTFANVATSDSYGADVNGSFRVGKLNGFGGFSAFRQVTDASNLSTDVSNEAIGWSARANGTYKLTSTLDAQAFVMYRAPMNTEQGRITSMSMTTLALRQKLLGDKASLTIRMQDPFDRMRFGFESSDARVRQSSLRRFGARGLFVNFSYNFGQTPRFRPRPQEQQPEGGANPTMGGPPA
ncbi:MAG TPA: TonB-dependent receptor [Gemmatimonadaceae bacterium]|nr:TonB-dependent receptor [Gemmatimonadaceae bacterium]